MINLDGKCIMYKLINLYSHITSMGLLGAAVVGGMVGRRSARRQMAGMQAQQAQAQQAQAQQAQAQQAQAQQAQAQQAQAQQAQAQQAQQTQPSAASGHDKTDPMQELQKLGELKQKGLLTDEEFQQMKASLLAKM